MYRYLWKIDSRSIIPKASQAKACCIDTSMPHPDEKGSMRPCTLIYSGLFFTDGSSATSPFEVCFLLFLP